MADIRHYLEGCGGLRIRQLLGFRSFRRRWRIERAGYCFGINTPFDLRRCCLGLRFGECGDECASCDEVQPDRIRVGADLDLLLRPSPAAIEQRDGGRHAVTRRGAHGVDEVVNGFSGVDAT